MYSIKSEPTCNSETYITSCVSEHEMISVKEENTSMVTVGKTEHENSMDFMKHEPGLCSESCPALGDENQVMNVKVEDLLAVEGEEGPLPVGIASINIKQECFSKTQCTRQRHWPPSLKEIMCTINRHPIYARFPLMDGLPDCQLDWRVHRSASAVPSASETQRQQRKNAKWEHY